MNVSVEHVDNGATAVLHLRGNLDVHTSRDLYDRLRQITRSKDTTRVVLDFRELDALDSAGIAVVSLFAEELKASGRNLDVHNLRDDHRQAFAMMPASIGPAESEEMPGFFESTGDRALDAWQSFVELVELLYDSLAMGFQTLMRKRRLPRGAVIEQAVLIGVDALLIIALLSFLLGLIMAFQSAYQLRQFGANIYVANLVGISMVREFGPMMTAIMLAGRSGSAIAAELGTMKVQEEVDALKTMGIDPVRFLVLPRLIALTFVQPSLTLMADFVGIFGGFLIGTLLLDLSASAYYEQTVSAVTMGDFWTGLSKSVVFAWIIGITGCYTGLSIEGGASSVGKATTRSVVTSIFLIIVADSIFATVTTVLGD